RDVAGIIAVEIFAQDFVGAIADAVAQRLADADAFSRDPESHGMPRLRQSGMSESKPIWSACNNCLVPTFPKFVIHRPKHFHELRKVMGTSKPMIRVPLFDLKSLGRTRGKCCKDLRSAALVAVRSAGEASFACHGGAAPRKESASLRGISRPCGGRYQCRNRAIVPRWCRRTGSRSALPRRSAA